jgi:hypothetical protein
MAGWHRPEYAEGHTATDRAEGALSAGMSSMDASGSSRVSV